jgi:UDP-3-O-[3-hydroxymyristoyl] N-acetylglucosamine deacetylase
MSHRTTLRRTVTCSGIGLHSGRTVRVAIEPAPAGHGVRFLRTDVGVEIPARVEFLARLDHATTLSRDGASIGTVEHLLSALRGLGFDDALVRLDGPEVPVLDGSSTPFVERLAAAGQQRLDATRKYLKLLEPVSLVQGDKSIVLRPADELRVTYTIAFDHPLLRRQSVSLRVTPQVYADEIAPARTFGFTRDVEQLRRAGLARGGSLDNAVVFSEDGLLTPLRFEDECVRHKVLDAIGDLALLGHPLLGHLEVVKGGHALHAALARKLLETPESWTLVELAERRPAVEPAVGVLALHAS